MYLTEIDATIDYYDLPEFAPRAVVERKKIQDAIRLADIAKVEGNYDSLCPPLKHNFQITEDIPEIILEHNHSKPEGEPSSKHVYYYMNEHVRNNWTAEDWRMHHWIYHRLTEDVDRQIGTILDALRENGLERNTIIVFTSDHGDMDGSHKMVHKGYFYDESTRVPFIISGPGVKTGVDREHLVSSSLDLIPTFCDFAGIDIPKGIQGHSIKPLALGDEVPNWREYVISENERGRMVRSARYKYNLYYEGAPGEMLIDMQEDPGELKNLALQDQYIDILRLHRGMLQEWIRR